MPADKLKNIVVEIKADFGSKFQEEFAVNCLMQMIQAWRIHLKNSHKKNELEVTMKFNQSLAGK